MQTCERFDRIIFRSDIDHVVKTNINRAVFESSRNINFSKIRLKNANDIRKFRMTKNKFDKMTHDHFQRCHRSKFYVIYERMSQKTMHRNRFHITKIQIDVSILDTSSKNDNQNMSKSFDNCDWFDKFCWKHFDFYQQHAFFNNNYETMHKSFQHEIYMQFLNEVEKNDDEMYFIDRRYRKNRLMRNRKFDKNANANANASFRKSFRFSNRRIQKCFVCDKIDCWFTNHFQTEQNLTKKKFENRHFQFKFRSEYERQLQSWIIEIENKNDENDRIHQHFEKLTIDAFSTFSKKISSINEINELFYISIDLIYQIESIVIADLINNVFKHRVIFRDDATIFENLTSYTYNAFFDIKYGFFEFKNLLINSKATIRSTKNIEQFKTLQNIDNLFKFNSNAAEFANFVFDMNTTTSIDSIDLKISIETIIFHIIQVNTSFLLCLIDFDKTEIYFNNLTNQLIQSSFFRSHSIVKKYEHVFLTWHVFSYSIIFEFFNQHFCFFIEIEFR